MRVAYISLDWSGMRDENDHPTPGGSGWYRLAMPVQYLQEHAAEHGHTFILGNRVWFDVKKEVFTTTDWDENSYEDLDFVVLSRWMDHIAPDAIRAARASGQVVINDVDDYFDGLHPSNAAWKVTHPAYSPQSNRNIYRQVLGASSGITVSTPFLKTKMSELNERVVLLRNAIDLERWQARDVSGDPIVGWVGATPYRSEDLQTVVHPVQEFLRSHPESAFFHGGAMPNQGVEIPELMGASGRRARASSMRSILTYPEFFANFNIGVVPLNNIPFNAAKSACKGLEYAASGIPFISTCTPEYEWLARAHLIGHVVRKPKYWKPALNCFADADYRIQVGRDNRARVEALDMELHWRDWLDAILEIARG